MDINTLILIVILGVMVYAMLSHGQEKKSIAESKRDQNISTKEELSQEEVATYGQVQERKNKLFELQFPPISFFLHFFVILINNIQKCT